jgi:hypothetical protein
LTRAPGGAAPFRFEVGEAVQVQTHPARPLGAIVERWAGSALGDPYGENIYQVSSFVTKQRESSLAPACEAGIEPPPRQGRQELNGSKKPRPSPGRAVAASGSSETSRRLAG